MINLNGSKRASTAPGWAYIATESLLYMNLQYVELTSSKTTYAANELTQL